MAKLRSPVWVAVWSVLTLYIYTAVWWYRINRELRDLGRSRGTEELGTSPGTSLLAVTLGALVILPPFFSMYGTGKRIYTAQRLEGRQQSLNGWLGVVMALLFAPVLFAYFQSELNKVWRTEAGL